MRRLRFPCVARVLLVVLFATFLSPAMGWAMVADHHELEHAAALAGHPEPGHEDHEHGDAHMWFGHLLGHLPAVSAARSGVAACAALEARPVELWIAGSSFLPDPPLRPPLTLLS